MQSIERKNSILILAILLYLFIYFSCSDIESDKSYKKIDSSSAMQSKRAQFIEDLKSQNIIYKIEVPAKYPHVYVGSKFYTLSFDDKSSFISVIAVYYLAGDNTKNIVVLYNWRTGKKIGIYDKYGLTLN